VELLDFSEALERSHEYARQPHVLLGNGFSIACRPECFRYDALLNEATFDGASTDIKRVFDLLGTSDFERVIELLQLSAELCDLYESADVDLTSRLRTDAKLVREALAQVLAARHPNLPFDISDEEYQAAREFLSHFARVYSLNYDMLLYWTIMKDLEPPIVRNDGFGNPDDDDAPYVVWLPYVRYDSQRVFCLHGGLHLYDRGPELTKITWSRTQIPLVDQIRHALGEGRFPLIVTEGQSAEKITKILHSAYFNHAIRSFSMIGGSLFMYGLSLAPNDEHLLRRIIDGRIDAIFVSIYGDPADNENEAIASRAEQLAAERDPARPLAVHFFDAASARVWG